MKKRVSKKQRDAIKQAAGAIPNMIAQDLHAPKQGATLPPYDSAGYQKRKRMMLIGVILLTIGITALVIVSMQNTLRQLRTAGSIEGQLYQTAKQDLGDIIAALDDAEERAEDELSTALREQEAKEQAEQAPQENALSARISAQLGQAVLAAANASSSASTTLDQEGETTP